jgi:hypothetical protein
MSLIYQYCIKQHTMTADSTDPILLYHWRWCQMYINVSFIFLCFNKIKQLYQIVFLVNLCWHLHICIKHVVNYIYIYFVYLCFSALINLTTGMRPFAPRTPGDINIEDVVKFSRQGGKLSQGKVKFVGQVNLSTHWLVSVSYQNIKIQLSMLV